MALTPFEIRRLGPRSNKSVDGIELASYLASLDSSRASALAKSSLEIMDLALASGSQRSSGLVLGQVQSGKTASIVGVISVSRDNDFPIVVVAAGSTELLQSQTMNRLRTNLGSDLAPESWIIRGKLNKSDSVFLKELLSDWYLWNSGQRANKPATLVVVPLKTIGLSRTAGAISAAFSEIGHEYPVLVIDDESDSASPNNQSQKNLKVGSKDRSATSERMNMLFWVSSKTKYLMYTATPQANLLMSVNEQLNPEFCYLLEPGAGYMGFHSYFLSGDREKFLRSIPRNEVVSDRSRTFPTHDAAIQALATFITGCAMQVHFQEIDLADKTAVRSMMMQVAQTKRAHRHFLAVAQFQIRAWLEGFMADPTTMETYDFFKSAIGDLHTTTTGVQLFQLHESILKVLKGVRIELMNSENSGFRKNLNTLGALDRVDWKESRFWILVGGIYMDRGFTVEGLQVSFMPRKPAMNEDSITQRARFFGYHAKYSSYIRVFMPDELQLKYIDIANNDLDLRSQLQGHSLDIRKWARNFRTSNGTSPTRKSVIGRVLAATSNTWVYPEDMHQIEEIDRRHNVQLVSQMLEDVKKSGSRTADLQKYQIHLPEKALIFEDMSMPAIYQRLAALKYAPDSSAPGLLALQAKSAKEQGYDSVTLVFIDKLEVTRLRGKSLDPIGGIGNLLWSGRSHVERELSGQYMYPGDRGVYNPQQPTIQLRLIKANSWDESEPGKKLFAWWAWINPNETGRLRELS